MESGQPHATHRPPSSPEEPHSTIACGTDFSVHARTGWNIIMQPHLNHPARAQDSSRTSPSTTAQLEHAPPFSRSLSGIRRLRSDGTFLLTAHYPSICLCITPPHHCIRGVDYPTCDHGFRDNVLIHPIYRILDRSFIPTFLFLPVLYRCR